MLSGGRRLQIVTTKPDSVKDKNLTMKKIITQVRPCIWEDVMEKINVIFTSEEYVQADNNLLPCAVPDYDDLLKTRKQKLMMRIS
jgi:hypothetical protein